MSTHDQREKALDRNPHGDFKAVEASRPAYPDTPFKWVQKPNKDWEFGDGANTLYDTLAAKDKKYIEIDPYEQGRSAGSNYKLLISAVVPRPVGFCSTIGKDGVKNLAPFSYFNVINHDPPLFIFGFAGNLAQPKDTLKNLVETKECTINILSPSFIEAANATSANIPASSTEWPFSGLTPIQGTQVKPPRVAEAIFSIEAVLLSTTEYHSRATPDKATGVLAVVEGLRFWAREDAVDAKRELINPAILRPIGRMGGITYGVVTEAFEIPRPDVDAWEKWNGEQQTGDDKQ